MKQNEIITALADEIMVDITNQRIALHTVMLKAARLSLMLDMAENVKWFKDNAKFAEQNSFLADTYQTNMLATQ